MNHEDEVEIIAVASERSTCQMVFEYCVARDEYAYFPFADGATVISRQRVASDVGFRIGVEFVDPTLHAAAVATLRATYARPDDLLAAPVPSDVEDAWPAVAEVPVIDVSSLVFVGFRLFNDEAIHTNCDLTAILS